MDEEEERKREIRRWLTVLVVFFLMVGVLNLFDLRFRVNGGSQLPASAVPEEKAGAGVGNAGGAGSGAADSAANGGSDEAVASGAVSPSSDSPESPDAAVRKRLAEGRELFRQAEALAAGKIVPDDLKAIELYRESAATGLSEARYRLAVMYQYGGDTLPQNVIVSYALFRLLEVDKDFRHWTDAHKAVRELTHLMTPEQVLEGDMLAKKFAGGGKRFLRALEQAPGQ